MKLTPSGKAIPQALLTVVATALGLALLGANAGAGPDATVAGWSPAKTGYFTDDFESGAARWSRDCTWGLTQAESRSPTHSLTDSPAGNYAGPSDCSATLATALDLSGALDPVLLFWHKGDVGYGDYGYVDVSGDGGASWHAVRLVISNRTQATWSLEQVDLGDWKSATFKVRFRLLATAGSRDGWYVDDVKIQERDPQRLSYPFADDLESGLGRWELSGHDWDLTTSLSRSATHSLTDSPGADYVPSTDCSATLAHPIDLSGADDPVLKFWWRGDFGYGDYAYVDLSNDGGSTWYPVRLVISNRLQAIWSLEQVDLRDWKSPTFRARLHVITYGGGRDGWYVDDVSVQEKDPQRLAFPFRDSLESGPGNWVVSGHDWGLTTESARTITHALTDDPDHDYVPDANCAAMLLHPIDLSATTYPVLEFWVRGHLGWGDFGRVEISTDGGTNWATLRIWDTSIPSTWSPPSFYPPEQASGERFDLRDFRTNNVTVRFRFESNGDASVADGWFVDDVRIRELADPTAVPGAGDAPQPFAFALPQNSPNPFNPITTLRFTLSDAGRARLTVYDLCGHRIRDLLDADLPRGPHTAVWDGCNAQGQAVASGSYIARLVCGPCSQTVRMELVR